MKKFMALYMAPAATIEQMMKATPEETSEVMAAWIAWGEEYADRIFELGAPLGKTLTVDATGTSETRNGITGYSIVLGESHDDAATLFDGHPHLELAGASIDLLEYVVMPGMDEDVGDEDDDDDDE